jgi:predicted nuclease of predicted toxin-antitoxin system
MQRKLGWEFWLDAHLSPIIAKWLQNETGYIVKSSFILELYGLDDIEIYRIAKANALPVILISKDSDFPQLISQLGSPPKLINLRFGNSDNKLLYSFLINNFEEAINRLIDDNVNIVDLIP